MSNVPGQRIGRFGAVVDAVLTAAILVWFDFFPEYVGYITSWGWPFSFNQVLLPVFSRYLVGLNLWWIATIALSLINIVVGRWTFVTWTAALLTRFYGVIVLLWMIAGPVFLTPFWLNMLIKMLLSLGVLGMTVDSIRDVVAYLRAVYASGHE
ncbi:MAG: hypothetical protein LLG44_02850 [Chloroflexi bacterium]|nr:hypothetical protein [Chloroflexota bacterium]